jgi:hypothetical protein
MMAKFDAHQERMEAKRDAWQKEMACQTATQAWVEKVKANK